MLGFLEFSLLFLGSNILLDALRLKLSFLRGLDFLFFAPWLAGAIYNLYQGLILGIALLAFHILFNLHLAIYEIASFPSQVVAVLLGSILGLGGYWIAFAAYFIISTAAVLLLRGFGGRFMMFLVIALVFNYLLVFSIPYFV